MKLQNILATPEMFAENIMYILPFWNYTKQTNSTNIYLTSINPSIRKTNQDIHTKRMC